MNIVILGAAGFIGTNLTLKLAKNRENIITVVDEKMEYFNAFIDLPNVKKSLLFFNQNADFSEVLDGQDVVYHLISTNNPTSSNKDIGHDITDNIKISINILETCVSKHIKKIVFLSSGGTVYGKTVSFPIKEESVTNPITTYGIQKLTIEKLLFLYHYVHGLEYAVIRLSNPYGPYQRPNGKLGVVTTFIHKALNGEKLVVYGDGSVIRDYIYISDAIDAIITIANNECEDRIFNLGSGEGTSINDIINIIGKVLHIPMEVEYVDGRTVDVPINVLDTSKYERYYGKLNLKSLEEGISLTMQFLKNSKQET